jgi:type I restriction enzyme S subunit
MKQKYNEYKSSGVEWIGEIPKHWDIRKMKYIGTINSGDTLSSELIEEEGEFPVYGGNGVLGYHFQFNYSNPVLSIGRVGEKCGVVHFVKEKVWINDNSLVFETFSSSDNLMYIFYSLRIRNLNSLRNQNTQPLITGTLVKNETIPIPPLPEQEQIIKYLDEKTSQIDQLITITEKKIEGLKEKRTSLINHIVTKGLDSTVEMKDSGVEWVGKIPKHWEVNKLKFVSNVRPSSVDKHIFQEENQVLLCNYTDVYYNEFIDENTELKKGSCSDEEYRKYKVKIGDVIITKDSETPDDIGIPCLIKSDFKNVVCGYHLSIITPKETVIGGYIFYQLKTQRVKSYFEINSNGITRYGLGKSSIEEILILLPPVPEQEKIVSYIDTETKKIDELISIEKKRIETLKEYRQIMISEVVTGKVRVCKEHSI